MGFTFDFCGESYGLVANDAPLFFIAGPCVIESRSHALETAAALKEVFSSLGLSFVYKSSFDKANRSSLNSWRGLGMERGLSVLAEIRETLRLPVLTDVHSVGQVRPAAEVVDILQIPAFLCRQTDLVLAAASAGKPLNIKKGQFLAPWEMGNVLEKARQTGNNRVCLCERGTFFGYGNLVVDMRGLEIMKRTGAPVIFDATHSVQLPGALGEASGGQREFVNVLARAAVAAGVAGLFFETHPDPDHALCDGPNMLPIASLPSFLRQIKMLDNLVKSEVFNLETREASAAPFPKDPREKLSSIRLIVTDIDGIWTDGSLYYGPEGEFIKKFNVRDGAAVKRFQELGMRVAVISGRDSAALRARLRDLGITIFRLGQKHKKEAFLSMLDAAGMKPEETLYIGDDIPDMEAFALCGLSVTVSDAPESVKNAADIILNGKGGDGSLLELLNLFLRYGKKYSD